MVGIWRCIRIYKVAVIVACITILFAPAVIAQVSIDVDYGFNGKFLGEYFTPVRVNIKYQGIPVQGELVVAQESHRPLEGTRNLSQSKEVRLGASADQIIDFYFPISRFSSQQAEDPILNVSFVSNGRVVETNDVVIPEEFESDPMVLVVSDAGFLRTLPSGERAEYVDVELLPNDWRGYDGVRRIYLGRVRADLFSKRQQNALKNWIYQGGELVVLGGENFFLQNRPWLSDLLPMAVSSIDQTGPNGLPPIAIGETLGDVLTSVNSIPLLLRRALSRGAVFFSTIDLSHSGEAEQAVWSDLDPGLVRNSKISLLGSELLDEMNLFYPDKVLIGGVLVFYLILFAYVSLWILKQPRWLIQRDRESGVPLGRRQQGWKVVTFIGVLVATVTLPALGYLSQPLFGSNFYSVEVGVISGQNGFDSGWNRNWYSVVAKKELSFQLAATDQSLINPLLNTSLMTAEHTDTYDLTFQPEVMQSWSKRHLYLEQMIPIEVRVDIQGRLSAVSQPQIQVYNEGQWHLEGVTVRRGRTYYALGDLPANMSLDRTLPQKGSTSWPEVDQYRDLWSFDEKVKKGILNHLENDGRSIHSSEEDWVLYAWLKLDQLSEQRGEHRSKLKLLVLRL